MMSKFIKKAKRKLNKRIYTIRRNRTCKNIKYKDFTIISNNCWAGKAYQYLDLPYLSPTVGLYFFADDYLRFVSDLRYYIDLDLKFISAEQSKYAEILKKRNQTHVPIGILDDVEIVFLHYFSENEAKEKWDRRKKRINYDNLIIKFSNMNLCTEKHLQEFDSLPFLSKFMLNIRKKPKYASEIYWSGKKSQTEILNDTDPFPGNLKLTKLLNIGK